jgi:hypothetical protein
LSLREEIKLYLGRDGLIVYSPVFDGEKQVVGNGLLPTALYYLCLAERGQVEINRDRANFLELVNRHFLRSSFDDYVGIIAAAHALVLPQISSSLSQPGHGPNRPLWWFSILRSSFAPKTDVMAWLRLWLQVQPFNWRGVLAGTSVRIWERRLRAHFPGGIRDVVAEILGTKHPIAKYWPEAR